MLEERSSGLLIPEDVNARKERMRAWRTKADAQARALQRELQSMDPNLEVDFVDPKVAELHPRDREPGVVPGRWHIIRRNPKGLDAWFPICGPNRSYRDPELSVVEDMKRADLWRAGALDELKAAEQKKLDDKKHAEELFLEQARDEGALAYRAAKRMNGDGGLTKRHDKK